MIDIDLIIVSKYFLYRTECPSCSVTTCGKEFVLAIKEDIWISITEYKIHGSIKKKIVEKFEAFFLSWVLGVWMDFYLF